MKRFQAILKYILFKKGSHILVVALMCLVVTGSIAYFKINNTIDATSLYSTIIDPFIGIFTFLLALFLAIQKLADEWKESLPRKLTVHFMFDEYYIMSNYNSALTSEADIRAWGQQIGKQMNNEENMPLAPYFEINKSGVIVDENFLLYQITFFLSGIDKLKNHRLKNEYRVWWDNDPTTKFSDGVYFEEHSRIPKTIEEAIAEASKKESEKASSSITK